jgi:hypothetical protein
MYDISFFEMIAGSRKRIYVELSPLTLGEVEQYMSASKPPSTPPDWVTACLRSSEDRFRIQANCWLLRDKEFAIQLSGLAKKHPKSRILVLRGAAHQRLLERLARE